MYDIYDLPKSIPLGRQGEQYARAVEIDCAKMLHDYPGARLTLMQRRTRGETARIVKADVSDTGVITWSPDMDAMAVAGLGAIEIVATVNDKVAKSVIAATAIAPSLTPPDTDTQSGWVKDVLDASDAAQGAMAAAQESAAAAAGSASAAQSSANAAAGSASAASGSATSAAGSADAASGSASNAAQSAAEADASAKASAASAAEAAGTLDSVKASADAAAGSARAAAESASDAASSKSSAAQSATDAAQAASAAAGSASQSAAAREAAQAAAAAASAAASDAAGSATAAAGSKDAAAQSASAAAASAEAADISARAAAQSAQGAAEAAKVEAAKIIQDGAIAHTSTWSSQKIVDQLYTEVTASGNSVVIENALEGYPMSVKASWGLIQEGEGEPYPAGGSKNVLSLDTWADKTIYGITFKRMGDGIHISGTATGNATSTTIPIQNLEPGKYYGWQSIEGLTQQLVIKPAGQSTNLWQKIDAQKYATVAEGDKGQYWYLNVITGTTLDYTIYPQIYKSDTAPTQFWPYSNIRPIKGRESVRVTRKNETQEDGKTLTLPTTIYGGEVDAVTGAGNANTKILTVDGDKIKFIEAGLYWNLPLHSASNVGGSHVYATSHFPTALFSIDKNYEFIFTMSESMKPYFATIEAFNTYLSAQYAAGTPMQIAYKLAAPESFAATGGGRINALAGTNMLLTDADSVEVKTRAASEKWAVVDTAQTAKMDYIAMMANVDMDALAVDDADADSGMDMPTDIEGSKTDGKQEV